MDACVQARVHVCMRAGMCVNARAMCACVQMYACLCVFVCMSACLCVFVCVGLRFDVFVLFVGCSFCSLPKVIACRSFVLFALFNLDACCVRVLHARLQINMWKSFVLFADVALRSIRFVKLISVGCSFYSLMWLFVKELPNK